MHHQKIEHTDINTKGWIGRLPIFMQPYALIARLDRPIGTWLLLLPCLWAIGMATSVTSMALKGIYLSELILLHIQFILGAVFMRSAGCVINDLWDKNFDAKVERTKHRPLASGALSVKQALLFLALLLFLSFLIFLQLNATAKILAVLSLIPVSLYPLAKRYTNWPQLVLGFTFNWGALLGFAAVMGSFYGMFFMASFWLWMGGIAWTMIYDTIYAHQDKADDAKLGLKSTALTLGDNTQKVALLITLIMGICFAVAGYLSYMIWPYYGALLLMVLFHAYQLVKLDINNPMQCLTAFKQSRYAGWILLIGIWLSNGRLYEIASQFFG